MIIGYEVHVVTNGTESFPNCDVKHQISIARNPFQLDNIKGIQQLRKMIEKEKFDIIHCHTPMGGVITRLAAKNARKKFGTKVLYTAHGFHFYQGAPVTNWLFFYPMEWYLAKYTDTLITINQEDYTLANRKMKKRCQNIQYIPGMGVDDNKYNTQISEEDKKALMRELQLSDDDFIMIFPARLDKNKNQEFLIDVIEKLVENHKNIHLLLPGNDELNGYYQTMVKNKGLDNHIHFLGHREDIPSLLKIANVAVSSSIREGFGINLVEALCCNIPIVAVNNRGHRDIVQDGVNGYLTSYNVTEFIEKILLIYHHKVNLHPKDTSKPFLLSESIKKMRRIYFGEN